MSKLYRNKEWLSEYYTEKRMSSSQIAEICGVNSQTILNALKALDIPTRNCHERSATTSKKEHPTNCTNCGKLFYVDMACKADPTNKRKFVRACSRKCTSALKASNIRKTQAQPEFKWRTGPIRKLNREELIQLICYEHKYLSEVAKILRVKSTTLSREIERLSIPNEFYRKCPQCEEYYTCKIRCQVDEHSNKFKKFCSRKCFFRSRKNTDTWIEREIAQYLTDNHVEFIPQYNVDRMTADFYIPSTNTIIEANGDFWHANPAVYPDESSLHHIQVRAIERDKRKLSSFSKYGYNVIVVWEFDLKHRNKETLSEMLTQIRRKEAV